MRPANVAVRVRHEFDEVVDGRVGQQGSLDDVSAVDVHDRKRELVVGFPAQEQVVPERCMIRTKNVGMFALKIEVYGCFEDFIENAFGSARDTGQVKLNGVTGTLEVTQQEIVVVHRKAAERSIGWGNTFEKQELVPLAAVENYESVRVWAFSVT